MNEDFIFAKTMGNINGMGRINVPANLEEISVQFDMFKEVIKSPLEILTLGHLDASHFINLIKSKPHIKPSGITGTFAVTVLQQQTGTIDLVIQAAITYTPGYDKKQNESEDIKSTIRSLYQDSVSFKIRPTTEQLWDIAQTATVPRTAVNEVNYRFQTGWSVNGGIEASVQSGLTDQITAKESMRASYTFQLTCSRPTKDFDIQRVTEGTRDRIIWTSSMKNCLNGNAADPEGYRISDPYSLVVNSLFTKWFKDVPDVAQSDYTLDYQVAYYSIDPEILNKVALFKITTTQRLIHGEIVGRFGLTGFKQGGYPIMLPFYVVNDGLIEIDFPNRHIQIIQGSTDTYSLVDILQKNEKLQAALN